MMDPQGNRAFSFLSLSSTDNEKLLESRCGDLSQINDVKQLKSLINHLHQENRQQRERLMDGFSQLLHESNEMCKQKTNEILELRSELKRFESHEKSREVICISDEEEGGALSSNKQDRKYNELHNETLVSKLKAVRENYTQVQQEAKENAKKLEFVQETMEDLVARNHETERELLLAQKDNELLKKRCSELEEKLSKLNVTCDTATVPPQTVTALQTLLEDNNVPEVRCPQIQSVVTTSSEEPVSTTQSTDVSPQKNMVTRTRRSRKYSSDSDYEPDFDSEDDFETKKRPRRVASERTKSQETPDSQPKTNNESELDSDGEIIEARKRPRRVISERPKSEEKDTPVKRKMNKWTVAEMEVVQRCFAFNIRTGTLPKAPEIQWVQGKFTVLAERTVSSISSYIGKLHKKRTAEEQSNSTTTTQEENK